MEYNLLTQKDLAKRWRVSVKAIESYRQQGLRDVFMNSK